MSATDESGSFSNDSVMVQRTRSYDIWSKKWGAWTQTSGMNKHVWGSKSRSGTTTPNYIHAAASGQLPENRFKFTRNESTYLHGVFHSIDSLNEVEMTGTFAAYYAQPPSLIIIDPIRAANLSNKVRQRVLEKAKEQSVNLAVAAAESGEAAHMIREKVLKLGKAFRQARSKNFAGAAQTLGIKKYNPKSASKSLSQGWLELQYGWLPLCSDIYGYAEHIQRIRGHGQYRKFAYSDSFTVTEQSISKKTDYTDSTVRAAKYTVKAVLKMQRNDPTFQNLAALGVTNPLQVTWEKVPFSFVIDWLVPLMPFLNQFDATVGWDFVDASVTMVSDCRSVMTRSSNNPPSYKKYVFDAECTNEGFSCERVPVLTPLGMWTLPYVKNPVSHLHLANAVALVTTFKR